MLLLWILERTTCGVVPIEAPPPETEADNISVSFAWVGWRPLMCERDLPQGKHSAEEQSHILDITALLQFAMPLYN